MKTKDVKKCFDACVTSFNKYKPNSCDCFMYEKKGQICNMFKGAWVPASNAKCLTWVKDAGYVTGRLYWNDDEDTQTTLIEDSCEYTG